ncbi:MAG: hypothetical protein QXG73_00440 [Candidatus Micrarchaeaceae archaeon]
MQEASSDIQNAIDERYGLINREMAKSMLDTKNQRIFERISASSVPENIAEGSVVDLDGKVIKVLNKTAVQGGGAGNYFRLMLLGEERNPVRVVLWRKYADLVDNMLIERNDNILAKALSVKKWQDSTEFSTTSATFFFRTKPALGGISDFSQLSSGMKNIDIIAKLLSIGSVHYFTDLKSRQRGVVRCAITDGAIEMPLVLWGLSSGYAAVLHPGNYIKVEYASVKNGNASLEIHADDYSRILASDTFRSRMQKIDRSGT